MSQDIGVVETVPRLPPRKSVHTPTHTPLRDTTHTLQHGSAVRDSSNEKDVGQLSSQWLSPVLGNTAHNGTLAESHTVCGTRAQHSLQVSLQELIGWLAVKEAELEEPWPLGGDLKTLQHQRQQHQFFEEELNSRTSFVHSALEAAQDFRSQHPLKDTTNPCTGSEVCVEQALGECVWHTAQKVEVQWQSVLRRCSARKRRLEGAARGLEELHSSVEEIQREIEEAQGIQQAWEPLGDLQIETLQDHVDAIGLFEDELAPVREGLKRVNMLGHQLCNAGVCLTEDDTHILHNVNADWRLLQECIEERLRELQDALTDFGSTSQHFLSGSVQSPWERAVSTNRVPYYINHNTQSTSWDHPRMIQLYQSMADLSEIRFSAYRTAMKLRRVQKALKLDCIPLISMVSELQGDAGVMPGPDSRAVEVQDIIDFLTSLYEHMEQEKGMMVDIPLCVDMCLNWLLSVYDSGRAGKLRLLSLVTGLVCLCDADVKDKCKYLFQQVCGADGLCDAAHLSSLLHELIQIPRQLGEATAFGGNNVEPSVNSCFRMVPGRHSVGEMDFLDWITLEPQSVVWLPVLQRVSQSERTLHHVRCSVCRRSPIQGFRYRSLKQFNVDICQSCFLSGRAWRGKTLHYPIIEYYTKSTSGEKMRAFAETLKNKFRSKQYFTRHPQRGYLPVQSTVGHRDEDSPSSSPKLPHSESDSSIEPFTCSRIAEIENQNCSFFNHSLDEEQYPLRYYSPVLESESLPCPHPLKYNHTCTEWPVALTTQPEYSNICTDWSVSPRREPEYTNICMDAPSSTYLHNCHTCVKQPIKQDLSGNSPRQQSRGQLQRTISNLEQQNKLLQGEYRRLQWQQAEAESQELSGSTGHQKSALQVELERRMVILEEHKEHLETQIQQLRTVLLQAREDSENSVSAGSSVSTCSPGPRPPCLASFEPAGVCVEQDNQSHTADHLQQIIEQLRNVFPSESDSTTPL